jgi:hypothetical protein
MVREDLEGADPQRAMPAIVEKVAALTAGIASAALAMLSERSRTRWKRES